MSSQASTTGTNTDGNEQLFVEKWLESNEEIAANVVERWLTSHPSRAKALLHLVSTQSTCESAFGSLDVDEEAQKVCKHLKNPKKEKVKPRDLHKLDKNMLFMELLRDVVSPNFDINSLGHKILVNVMLLVNADRSSLFLSEESQSMLVSRLFDVTIDSAVEDALHDDADAIKIPFGKGIAGHVAATGKPINIPDAYSVCTFTFTMSVCTYLYIHCRTHDSISRWTRLQATRQRPFCACQF